MKVNPNLVIKAIQAIYPKITGGFCYWETKQDGSDWENPIDGLVWENTLFEKPTWNQISDLIPSSTEIKKRDLKEKLISPRLKYLEDTDFRVLRFIDEGTPCPDEIKNKRIKARQEINEIEACNAPAALDQFSEAFE